MDRLPEEVILHILSFLAVAEIVHLQSVSSRYLALARDNATWKNECFINSRAESARRRQQLLNAQDPKLAELRNAVTALPGGDLTAVDVAQLRGSQQIRASHDPQSEAKIQRARALANWEPAYPDEKLDYYEEFIHRHAPINVGWLDLPKAQISDKEQLREATGIGTLRDHNSTIRHIVAPLDDGCVCIWDASGRGTRSVGSRGRLIAKSSPGLLTGKPAGDTSDSRTIMTETGAVECVAIDSNAKKGYFAVQNLLHEVDLDSLQLMSSKQYPFPITALSEASNNVPITVGTNSTIHLHDPRDPAFEVAEQASDGELIGGSIYSHATLSQPGPLSILHENDATGDNSSIWVAGRFTSLLNYDRRFFPRLRETVFSGARIASLSSLPYPFIPRSLDLVRNPSATITALQEARSSSGTTILAAAEYKGKGSLELHGLPLVQPYLNRQTASASKLLSVACHGGRIVFSDGDGNLKWLERDGFSHVRTFNINDTINANGSPGADDASAFGIWSSTASEMPGQGDIVQKIVPAQPVLAGSSLTTAHSTTSDRSDVNQSDLLLWTGDGRIGVLGFGRTSAFAKEGWHDAMEAQSVSTEQKAKDDAEKQYGMAMRRALERNADEVRFVRGLGMGFTRY